MNDLLILIILSSFIIYYYKYPFKKIESFKSNVKEKCIKDTYNKLSDGTKTFFSNEMINTKLDLDKQFDKVINNNTETNNNLGILNKTVKSSTKKFNHHNELYNRFNNDFVGIFGELNRTLDVNKSLIDGRKMGVDTKFAEITNKVNSMVGSVKSSGIQNKLTAIINPQIDKQLVENATKAAEDYNVGGKMMNRINTSNSKIYEWQIVDGYTCPLRINAETGEVECLSYDGKNCEWTYTKKYGNNITNIKSDEVKSLQCGPDHKRHWRSTGYENVDHWCSKNYRYFAKMGEDNIDFKACPKDWSLIEPKTTTCIAPFDYTPPKEIVPVIFEGSELIPSAGKEWLRGLLPAKTNTKLLYRGSRDGMNASAWHSKVNGNGANITILKNSYGDTIGGYTSLSWNSSGSYKRDDRAFLFNLTYGQKFSPTINPGCAICDVPQYGPTFGCGHDLMIFGWSHKGNDSYHNINSYNYGQDSNGKGGGRLTKLISDAGGWDNMFKVTSIETWQILSSSFSNSQIIGNNGSWQNSLNEWLGNAKKEVELLFRATRDGFNSATFHRICDNKGPTITLVRDDQGRCFGGYSGVNWSTNGSWQNDSTAFMFSFNRNKKVMSKYHQYSTYNGDRQHYGPTFGGGHDMILLYVSGLPGYENWNGGANCYLNAHTFTDDNTHIAGGQGWYGWFKAQEIEVWSYNEKSKAIAINDDRCKSRECVSLSVLQNIEQKQRWSLDYNARFPFKLSLGGITEKHSDVSKKATKEIDLRLGNTDKPINASLENYKLYKNGIVIKTYKTDNNFKKGASYNHEFLGTNINFNWGTGIIMALPNAIKDNIYLEMIGYLKIPAKKVIFRVGSDDGVRFFISKNGDEKNMDKIFDNWTAQPYNTVESDVLEVSQDVYLPFLLEYFEFHSSARLTLEWALDDNAFRGTTKYEIISSKHFYYDKSTCADSIKPISNFNYK
jgi:hypothetical protein